MELEEVREDVTPYHFSMKTSLWHKFKVIMKWLTVSDAEFVTIQLNTLRNVNELTEDCRSIKEATKLVAQAIEFEEHTLRDLHRLPSHLQREMVRISQAKLQFAVENADRVINALTPVEENIAEVETEIGLFSDEN